MSAQGLEIKGYSQYLFSDNRVFNKSDGKEIPLKNHRTTQYFYIFDDEKKKRQVSIGKVRSLVGMTIPMPKDAREIRGSDGEYFIDRMGVVYGFSNINPDGAVMTPTYSKGKYARVTVKHRGKHYSWGIHQLMCDTFILSEYIEKGFVCLHADNNKHNYSLDNLSVGTYSENNKDAYRDGINKGNQLGISGSKKRP